MSGTISSVCIEVVTFLAIEVFGSSRSFSRRIGCCHRLQADSRRGAGWRSPIIFDAPSQGLGVSLGLVLA